MCPPTDSPSDGLVNANRVVQTKSLIAGFTYGDQSDSETIGSAYQLKSNDNSSSQPIQRKAASMQAPSYNISSSTAEGETETTQLKEEGNSQVAGGANPGEGDEDKANDTGLPSNLKSAMENLAGMSLDDVKVHYNSSKPEKLNAAAFAQGTDIHLATGQEKHLPHELWHVVQQKQGRVKATIQVNGKVPVNDDDSLEKEADAMGEKASQMKDQEGKDKSPTKIGRASSDVSQLVFSEAQLSNKIGRYKFARVQREAAIEEYAKKSEAELQAIRVMPRKDFDKVMDRAYLERDAGDPFAEVETGWIGWGLSFLGLAPVEDDGDGPEANYAERSAGKIASSANKEGLSSAQNYEDLSDTQVDKVSAGKDLEEEEDSDSLATKGIKAITINLIDAGGEEHEADLGRLGSAKGKGKAGLEYTPGDNHKVSGSAEIEFQMGHESEPIIGNGTFGSTETNMSIGGAIQGLVGAKAEGAVEGEFNPSEQTFGMKGKAGASIGASAESTVRLMVRAKGVELATANITGGVMAGLAAQGGFTFEYAGGTFTLGGGGKLAAGIGLSWNYHMSLNTPGLMAKLGNAIAAFGSWGYSQLPSIR